VLAKQLKKVVPQGVFAEAVHVSEDDMSTASATLVSPSSNENTLVAQGLKRHDPELLDGRHLSGNLDACAQAR
jgi:RNA polymerase sigma-70 factor (ECF subfamily)